MSHIRIDRNNLPRVQKTSEGYLRGDAVVTRIGVFPYLNEDGSTRYELRHPEDVLSQESLETLKMIPITVDHPSELVSSDNVDGLSVGHTGESIRVDGRHVKTRLTITGAKGVAAVSAGKSELSLGYLQDLVKEDGVYEGQSYTHRQTNIRYNHLALVEVARAGRTARLNLDGASVQSSEHMEEKPMLKVTLDGISYDAVPEVARALEKAHAEVAANQSRADRAEAERDDAKARADKAESEKLTPEAIEQLVSERTASRLDVLTRAAKVLGDDFNADGKSDREVREAAVKHVHKDVVLEGKSDDYVTARFDAVVDSLQVPPAGEDPASKIRRAPTDAPRNDAQSEEEAYQKSITNLNAHRLQK